MPAGWGTFQYYATCADDLTCDLHWYYKTPNPAIFPGPPWPCVLIVHGGGFKGGDPQTPLQLQTCGDDMVVAGYAAFSIEYRVAYTSGHGLTGQTFKGIWPIQQYDAAIACSALRADSRCNGTVVAIGGSGGGFQVCWLGAVPPGTYGGYVVNGRPDVVVALSGCYDFTDRVPATNLATAVSDMHNYNNVPDDSPGSMAIMLANSVVTNMAAPIVPTYFANSVDDSMPTHQIVDIQDRCTALGIANCIFDTFPGRNHAFGNWLDARTRAIQFIHDNIMSLPPPPPPPPPPGTRILLRKG